VAPPVAAARGGSAARVALGGVAAEWHDSATSPRDTATEGCTARILR
jgi:hypothetical protein